MPTDIIKSVGATGRDYATIPLFLAAMPANRVTADERWIGELYKDAAFSGAFTVSGTSDATRNVIIRTATGQRHTGTEATGVRVDGGGTTTSILLDAAFTEIIGIDFFGFNSRIRPGATGCKIQYCIIRDVGSSNNDGIYINAASITLTVERCLFYNITRSAINLQDKASSIVNVRHCTAWNVMSGSAGTEYCGIGWDTNSSSAGSQFNVWNTYVHCANSRAAYHRPSGVVYTGSHNGSYDGTATTVTTFTSSVASLAATNQFQNLTAGSEDLQLKTGSGLIEVGTNTQTVLPDLAGRASPTATSIGAFEWDDVGGGTNGNATVSLTTITVSAPTVSAAGGASTSVSLPTITVSAPTVSASATGNGDATVSLPTITVSAPTVSATGDASTSVSLPTITVSSPTVSATGGGLGSVSLPTIAVSAPSVSATGDANTSVSLPTVTIGAPTVSAIGGAAGDGNATVSLPTISISGPTVSATGEQTQTEGGSVGSFMAAFSNADREAKRLRKQKEDEADAQRLQAMLEAIPEPKPVKPSRILESLQRDREELQREIDAMINAPVQAFTQPQEFDTLAPQFEMAAMNDEEDAIVAILAVAL